MFEKCMVRLEIELGVNSSYVGSNPTLSAI
ncbi:hypothetical protein KM92DES2_12203 [uncultured Desulfovibrio sp.]|uniref:Uncharacterized protein n=1 Tax=uncultured Desulfovibrio sp. TaxID=167968 RepID=A0A212K4F8_9BACT|nr:hypothetical protein KM92DES2_12203 [uncultured Desulfovibrio sp.]